MPGLQETVRKVLLDKMVHAVVPMSGSPWKVLVLDEVTTRIMSAACQMFDIMEEGISLVENLNIDRQPLPDMDVIYFITASDDSINKLCKDFVKPSKPQYGDVHLFFTSRISDAQLAKLKNQTCLLQHVKCLKELNLEFLAVESNVFTFDRPGSFIDLYSPDHPNQRQEQDRIAQQLLTVCAALGEYPAIRYARGAARPQSVGAMLQGKMDDFKRQVPTYPSSTEGQATLIIIDRSQDPIAPVIHESTYQAIAYDLLDIQKDRYKYVATLGTGEKKDKEVLLNENDVLWPSLRHMHIGPCSASISDGFKKFATGSSVANLGKKDVAVSEMGDAMRNMAQHNQMVSKYSLHMDIIGRVMKDFDKIEKVNEIEQNMVMGEDGEGNPLKGLGTEVSTIVRDPATSSADKMRLLMAYFMTQDVRDGDRLKLMEIAGLSIPETTAVQNLKYVGQVDGKPIKRAKKKDKKKAAECYTGARFAPLLKDLLTDLLEDKLSTTDYPYEREPMASGSGGPSVGVSQRSARPKAGWASARGGKDKKKDEEESQTSGPRVIVFVIGGMTHSEMRTAYEFAATHHREVIIGSTHIATPKVFLQGLSSLHVT